MLCFLVIICPNEFFVTAGSIKDLYTNSNDVEDIQIFDELIFQIKEFFINRNLDGKSLFRVLSKQAQKYLSLNDKSLNNSTDFNYAQYKDELLCKVFELVFAISFFCKDNSQSLSQNVFDKAVNKLSESRS